MDLNYERKDIYTNAEPSPAVPPKPKSFFQRLVDNAKERLKKFSFADPLQADAAAMAVLKQEAAFLRHEHIRGSMIRNRIARQRTKKRMERRSRQINYAKARA